MKGLLLDDRLVFHGSVLNRIDVALKLLYRVVDVVLLFSQSYEWHCRYLRCETTMNSPLLFIIFGYRSLSLSLTSGGSHWHSSRLNLSSALLLVYRTGRDRRWRLPC